MVLFNSISILIRYCFLAALLAEAHLASAQTGVMLSSLRPAQNGTVQSSPFGSKQVVSTLPKTLEAISDTYQINIVCDAFVIDAQPHTFPVINRSSGSDVVKVLQDIAANNNLEVSHRNDLYIVRHKRWAFYYKEQQTAPPQWGGITPFHIDRLDKMYASVASFVADAPDAQTPAQLINVSGTAISCARLTTVLQKEANWTVHVSPKVAARRIHVFGRRVDPAALLGAVAYLVNAAQEITLKPTDAQFAAENYDSLRYPDFIRNRLGPSDALRADMEKLLTKEQQAGLQKGEYLAFPVGSLPPALQQRAHDYISLSVMLNNNAVATPDQSRWKDFQIRFLPPNAGLNYRMLGVVTVASDGTEYFF